MANWQEQPFTKEQQSSIEKAKQDWLEKFRNAESPIALFELAFNTGANVGVECAFAFIRSQTEKKL